MTSGGNILQRMRLPGSPVQLAVLRVTIGAQVFYAVHSEIFSLLLAVGDRQPVRTIFPGWLDDLLAAHTIPALLLGCKVLSVLLVIGLFTRVVLPLLTIAFLLLFSFYYLGANAPAQWLYMWFPLLVFCWADTHAVWSLDAWLASRRGAVVARKDVRYRWPLELCVLWFCYIYFAAGVAKVLPVIKGVSWLNGQTSKEIIYNRFLDSPFHYVFGEPFFNYADGSGFFAIITVMALLLELYTVVLLFTARRHLLILFMVTIMHLFLYMTGVAGFTQTALVLGVALMPMSWFERSTAAGRRIGHGANGVPTLQAAMPDQRSNTSGLNEPCPANPT